MRREIFLRMHKQTSGYTQLHGNECALVSLQSREDGSSLQRGQTWLQEDSMGQLWSKVWDPELYAGSTSTSTSFTRNSNAASYDLTRVSYNGYTSTRFAKLCSPSQSLSRQSASQRSYEVDALCLVSAHSSVVAVNPKKFENCPRRIARRVSWKHYQRLNGHLNIRLMLGDIPTERWSSELLLGNAERRDL